MAIENNKNLIIFARFPEAGKVKTRLAADLGAEKTVALYRLFVEQTLQNLNKLPCRKHLFFFPQNREAAMKEWLCDFDLEFYEQAEGELGEKICDAFKNITTFFPGNTLIIGTDSPDLPAKYISRAFAELENNDAVIGPSKDGGYYLVGFAKNKFSPDAFSNINWSTSAVFAQTNERLKNLQQRVAILDEWYDIDTAEDLKTLYNSSSAAEEIKEFLQMNCASLINSAVD